MNKEMDLKAVVAQLRDGMKIGFGGWGPRRKPMALVREILRSDLKDLTIVAYGGADVGMLCAAGKVKKLIFAFVSLDAIPLEPWFRKSREAGAIEVLELDEGMFQWGLSPQAAIDLPNFGTLGGPLMLESGRFPPTTVQALQQRGHEVREVPMPSGLQAIQRSKENGQKVWLGGADPRREGIVSGD